MWSVSNNLMSKSGLSEEPDDFFSEPEKKGGQLQIVLVGGWAQTAQALRPLAQQLATLGTVHLVILNCSEEDLQKRIASIIQRFAGRTLMVGWSLGGQLLLRTLSRSTTQIDLSEIAGKLAGKVLIACNPYYIGDDRWPGVGETVFDQFQEDLAADPVKLLTKFCKLQVLGGKDAKLHIKSLAPALLESRNLPADILKESLAWLRHWDCRALLQENTECVWYFGKKDHLVPIQLAARLLQEHQMRQIVELSDMAHYPHPAAAARITADFQEHLQR